MKTDIRALSGDRGRFGALGSIALGASLLCTGSGCGSTAVGAWTSRGGFPEGAARASCQVTGEAQVIASHTYADELQVQPDAEGGFRVIVVDAADTCLRVHVAPDGRPLGGPMLDRCPAASPPGEATATTGLAKYTVHETWDGSDSSHLTVGVMSYDWPRAFAGIALPGRPILIEHTFQAAGDGAVGDETEPKLSRAAGDSVLLVWVQGDAVRAQPLFRSAEPAGPPLRVSQESEAEVEHPSVALSPTSSTSAEGIVTYAARTATGFHVVATPVACSWDGEARRLVAKQ